MIHDFNILFCPICSEEVKAKTSNFCDKCGLCFKKKCKNCEIYGFWESCYSCGVKMVNSTGNHRTNVSSKKYTIPTDTNQSDSDIDEPSPKVQKVSISSIMTKLLR